MRWYSCLILLFLSTPSSCQVIVSAGFVHHHHHMKVVVPSRYSSFSLFAGRFFFSHHGSSRRRRSLFGLETTNMNKIKSFGSSSSSSSSSMTSSNTNNDNNAAAAVGGDDPFSLEHLHERMAHFVKDSSSDSCSCPQLSVAVAGGGSHFLSELTATPGASAILLQGLVTYGRSSYHRFVNENSNKNNKSNKFLLLDSYASAEASLYLAQAAAHNAMVLSATASSNSGGGDDGNVTALTQNMARSVGLACASAVQTTATTCFTTKNTPSKEKPSRAHITTILADGRSIQLAATLATGTNKKRTSRWQEDVMMSHCMLSCLEYAQLLLQQEEVNAASSQQQEDTSSSSSLTPEQVMVQRWTRLLLEKKKRSSSLSSAGDDDATMIGPVQIVTGPASTTKLGPSSRHSSFYSDQDNDDNDEDPTATATALEWTERTALGDTIHVRIPVVATTAAAGSSSGDTDDDHVTTAAAAAAAANDMVMRQAAQLILEGRQDSVMLVPVLQKNRQQHKEGGVSFQRLFTSVLPPNSLVFPGSFNPPHTGHVQLVEAVVRYQQQHQGSGSSGGGVTAWFELALTNADKPPLQVDAVVERLQHFLQLAATGQLDNLSGTWGIVLTNAPFFSQKVNLLQPLVLSSPSAPLPPSTTTNSLSSSRVLSFGIGADTLARLLNPVYYNNSQEQMLQALTEMCDSDCHFYVGGRLDQQSSSSSSSSSSPTNNNNVFMTGQEYLDALPPRLASQLFTLLPDFRVDISSTDIRNEQNQQS